MSFYSNSSYSPFKVNSNVLTNGTPPVFTNVNSFSFDGIDDYFMGVGGYTELTSGTAMSVSVWFKSSTYTTLGRLLNIGKHVDIYQNSALYSNTQGTFTYRLRGNFGNSFATLGGGTNLGVANLVDGQWHHLCFTWNGATTTAKVYEDGVLKVTNTSASGTLNNSTTDAYSIGAEANGNRPIDGLIDEPAVWTIELSSTDIATIYNNGVPNNLNDLSTPPTTWSRMGDLATWNGATWTMTDVNGGYTNRSINMVEANRTTDVPTIPYSTKSILLDGVDDRVQLSSDFTASAEFTVSFWMKPTAFGVNGSQYVLGQWGVNPNNIKLDQAGQIHFKIGGTGLIISEAAQGGSNNLVLNIWQHLLFVRDSSNNIKCFRNGVSYGSTSGLSNTNTLTYNSIGRVITNTFGFSGGLDEIAFWNSDQSANLSAIYGSGVPTSLASYSPLHWYRCGDGDVSPILTDNGSGGNNGTRTNFTTFSTDVPT